MSSCIIILYEYKNILKRNKLIFYFFILDKQTNKQTKKEKQTKKQKTNKQTKTKIKKETT